MRFPCRQWWNFDLKNKRKSVILSLNLFLKLKLLVKSIQPSLSRYSSIRPKHFFKANFFRLCWPFRFTSKLFSSPWSRLRNIIISSSSNRTEDSRLESHPASTGTSSIVSNQWFFSERVEKIFFHHDEGWKVLKPPERSPSTGVKNEFSN